MNTSFVVRPSLCLTLLFLGTLPLYAQDTIDRWTPDNMIKFKRLGDLAISADGKLVAYTIATPVMDGEKSEFLSQVWVTTTDAHSNRQYTFADKPSTGPAFSPDGRYLAFLSSRGPDDRNQVWALRCDGGEAEQLTSSKSGVLSYRWSSDSKRIAYLAVDTASDREEKEKKEKRDMVVVNQDYKYAHLYTIGVETDAGGTRPRRRLTAGFFNVTSFDWSPDGNEIVFAFTANPTADVWLTSNISVVPSDSGPVRVLVDWKGSDASPKFSPDGTWIAFSSDGGEPHWAGTADLYVIPRTGGQARKLGESLDRSAVLIDWSADGKMLYYSETERTSMRLFSIPVDGGKPRVVSTGPGNTNSVSFDAGRTMFAFIQQTSETPPQVCVSGAKVFQPRQLTKVNHEFAEPALGKTEVIKWKSKDGREIEGLLTYPVNYEKGRRYPLVLMIHGGPTGAFTEGFTAAGAIYPLQAMAQEGYAILRPNPRGSSGYGREFRFANYDDWSGMDYEDDMAGVDKVISMGIAHVDSLVVCGWSYGGYMTSTIVTKTNRFKAASVGAGVTDLVSFTGTSDIPSFLPDYFGGEPWERTETYLKHSAMHYVKGVTTPTQVIHGLSDVRVPPSQGYEFYNALKRQGCLTEMIVYPRTPHGPQEPKFIADIGRRVIHWFNLNLGRLGAGSSGGKK